MKPIIIYYSLTGRTGTIARSTADELQCEIMELREINKRNLIGAFLTGALAALRGKESDIEPLSVDISNNDLIILATPVWASSPVPAVNAFIARTDLKGKNIVFLLSSFSGDDTKAATLLSDRINKKGGRVLTHHGFKTGRIGEEMLRAQAKEVAKLYK